MTKEKKHKGGAAKVCVTGALVVGLSVACIPSAIAYSTEKTEAAELTAAQQVVPAEYEKTEVVYATLSASGAAKGVYVVNQFDVSAAGVIEDFGDYSTVVNLTDQAQLKYADEATSFEVGEGAFYYQGNTAVDAAKLPWNVAITYTLDGVAVSPEEVAGKSGDLAIHVTTSRAEGVDPAFAESYMLQITLTLNGDTTTDIQGEGATIAQSGRNRTVAFTALPGKNADCTLTAKVTDFEMAGIQIAALPYAMVMEMPDTSSMEGQMEELSNAISEMNAGMADLAAGSAAFGEGLGLTAQGAGELAKNSQTVGQYLAMLSAGLSVDNIQQTAAGLEMLAGGLDSLSDGLGGYQKAVQSFAQMYSPLTEEEQAALGAFQYEGTEVQKSLISKLATGYSALYQLDATLKKDLGNGMTLAGVMSTACGSVEQPGSLRFMAAQLRTIAAGLDDGNQGVNSLADAAAGLAMISAQYAQFDAGLAAFAGGVADLNANYTILNEGTQQFAGGLTQLNQATIKIPATMRAEIEKMMEEYDFPEFVPVSFVDDRNDEHMVAVQFVMTTDAIAVEEPEAEVEEEEVEQTIVDRFFALFE